MLYFPQLVCYLLITNSKGSASGQSSLEHIQVTQTGLLALHTDPLRARPPEGASNCFGDKFTRHLPQNTMITKTFLIRFPSSLSQLFPPQPTTLKKSKKRTTKKQRALIKWLQPPLLTYFWCTLWSKAGTRGFLATVNRRISETVPEYVWLETGKAGSFLLSSVLHSEIHNRYSHDSDVF